MTSPADVLLHELNAIKEYIEAVQGVLATGRMPEMIGLEQRIDVLCKSIQEADKETQQTCLPELHNLLNNIDACERDLHVFHTSTLNGKGTP